MLTEPHIPESWTEAECWVWEKIRLGQIADFNVRHNRELAPENSDDWSDTNQDRRLSKGFLETVLSDDRFGKLMTHKGAQIVGAWIEEPLNLQHVHLNQQLWLEYCRIEEKMDLLNLRMNGWFSLEGSWIGNDLDLNGAVFSSHVSMKDVIATGDLDLITVKVEGQLDMSGSLFDGELALNGIVVEQDLMMDRESVFEKVNLTGAAIGGQLNMRGCVCNTLLSLNSVVVGQHALLGEQSEYEDIDLSSAQISGQLNLNNCTINGILGMNSALVEQEFYLSDESSVQEINMIGSEIKSSLDMRGLICYGQLNMSTLTIRRNLYLSNKASLARVDMSYMQVDGTIDFAEGNISEYLEMNSIHVGRNLFLRNDAVLRKVNLNSAHIGGQLDLSRSIIHEYLTMDGIKVGQEIFIRDTEVDTPDYQVVLYYATIGSDLDLTGSTFGTLNLTGSSIKGELRLGSAKGLPATNWKTNALLILRNASVSAIQDTDDAWPDNLELEGFTYQHLGGLGAEGTADIQKRKRDWFIRWLERDKTFSPQPYEDLANLLQATGYPSKANAILYASRKRARQEAWVGYRQRENSLLRWIGMLLLETIIGYGLGSRYFRVLWWFAAFTLLGFFVLLGSTDKTQWDIFHMVWASFDQVLPLVKLNPVHESTILGKYGMGIITYFYFHKMIGYVLGGFLAAGLAGLTQRS